MVDCWWALRVAGDDVPVGGKFTSIWSMTDPLTLSNTYIVIKPLLPLVSIVLVGWTAWVFDVGFGVGQGLRFREESIPIHIRYMPNVHNSIIHSQKTDHFPAIYDEYKRKNCSLLIVGCARWCCRMHLITDRFWRQISRRWCNLFLQATHNTLSADSLLPNVLTTLSPSLRLPDVAVVSQLELDGWGSGKIQKSLILENCRNFCALWAQKLKLSHCIALIYDNKHVKW